MEKIIVSTAIMLVFAFRSSAQIEGNVVDTAGKAIPDATIIAIDTVKNTADSVKSDKIGFYVYKGLRRGKYKIIIRVAGFQNAVYENIVINNETPDDDKTGSDISNHIWLEIILMPLKATSGHY